MDFRKAKQVSRAVFSSAFPFIIYLVISIMKLRNKILYGLRLLKPTIVKECRSLPTGDVTVNVPPIGVDW